MDRVEQAEALLSLGQALKQVGYEFVTTSPATHARVNARRGNETAADLREILGWSRPFRPDVVSEDILDLMNRADVLDQEDALLRSRLRASTLDGEVFFHSAYPTTAADSVFFGPDTYRFARAVAAWLNSPAPRSLRRAVDIGTGAGSGGILVARACPDAEVLLVDINGAALRLAAVNAALAGSANAVALESNLLSATDGTFDLIVSNPPYLNDPLQRAYRHGGGDLGAALSHSILDASLGRLSPGGTLLLYTGVAIVKGVDPFLRVATESLRGRDVEWRYGEVDPDVFGEELETDAYAGVDRIAAVVLTVTRKV